MIKIGILESLILFLLTKINGITSDTIKIKFKTLKFSDEKIRNQLNIDYNQNNDEEKYFYYDLILNNIYSEILIGSPPQKIIGFYSGKSDIFSLSDDKCFIKNSKYDRTLSNTFHNISDFNICYQKYEKCCFAKENFEFESYDNKYNKIFFKDLKFFLTDIKDKNKNICGLIGLRLNYQDMFIENPKNFIYYLMHYFNNNNSEKINSYYWTIKYENKNDGFISIGEPPHIYDTRNLYKNKKFNEFNMEARYSTLSWAIQFNQIFINKGNETIFLKKYSEGHNCVFYPEINIILSTVDYFNKIKQEFFNKFIDLKICFIKKTYISDINSTIIEGLSGEYILFYCDKNKLIEYGINNFYSEFPSLNFYHNLFNYNFTLTGKDLFFEDEINNKIYFLIGNKNNHFDQWIFGKIFMNKFEFVFNSEMKTVGYYSQINNFTEKENNFEFNHIKLIIIVIVIIIIITFISFIACKKGNIFLKDNNGVALEMKLI